MTNQHKICILIPYFGTWPKWFPYYLLSCKYNPSVDWYFFTDCGALPFQNKNLFLVEMTLGEFNSLTSKKLNLPVHIKHPYKVCDFKPAYGKIFIDFIRDYDFWGYGDLDLVFGNIPLVINNDILNRYDIVASHANFIPGHFCLLKNTFKIRNLYMDGANFKKIFKNQNYQGFDEQLGLIKIRTNPRIIRFSKMLNIFYHLLFDRIFKIYKIIKYFFLISSGTRANIRKKTNIQLRDFTSIVNSNVLSNKIRAHFKTIFLDDLMFKKSRLENWKIVWEKGKLTDVSNNNEIVYFHFMVSKNRKSFHIGKFSPSLKKFTITWNGITPEYK